MGLDAGRAGGFLRSLDSCRRSWEEIPRRWAGHVTVEGATWSHHRHFPNNSSGSMKRASTLGRFDLLGWGVFFCIQNPTISEHEG